MGEYEIILRKKLLLLLSVMMAMQLHKKVPIVLKIFTEES